jgi:diaminohydroxyphosphoribosylaminopyrimidine deaminase/5-amino-6-(5-phosphoribosylamino)uracil reductase
MQNDDFYMQRCIDLARLGAGQVAPNPMVGAVIVYKDRVIGEGYHQKYGEAHAEVKAINSVTDRSVLKKSTIYVSLEPCAHYGKTPPCADLIVATGIKRVVIGCQDSYSEVSGKGILKLMQAGIDVSVGVLEEFCRDLNKRFFTFHEKKRPYIVLKWAQTADGFLDKRRKEEGPVQVNWISCPETQSLVHKWRSEEQAIMVGRKTVQSDNPSLTVREVSGRNPIRIIVDSQLQITKDAKIFQDDAPTIIFNRIKDERINGLEYVKVDRMETKNFLQKLHERNIQSVFVEGGAKTLNYFLIENLWDEARVIEGQGFFEEGIKAPRIQGVPVYTSKFGSDTIYYYVR